MYPTVVVILVETQRSMTDICEISSSDPSRLARPVASGARAAMDNAAESPPSRALQSRDAQERDLEEAIQLGVNLTASRVTNSG